MPARVARETDREEFNGIVASSPLADVLQSWEWGEVKRATGWSPVRLILDGNGPRAACSMLIRRPARGIPPLAYAPRGPVAGHFDTETLRALLSAAREHAAAFVFICDPAVEEGSEAATALGESGLRRVRSEGFGGVQPKAVMVLDLAPGQDEIFGNFKSKWRYNVRLASKKGVKIREGEREDLPAFYDLLNQTAERDGFSIRGRRYYDLLWEHLVPAGMLRLFLAEYQEQIVAGIMLFCMGGRAVYTYGASSNRHRNVMPNHLIQWHAIQWAKENGYAVYDFRGVSPVVEGEPVEPKLAGLNRFKEGFGARYVEYAGQFEYPVRPGWYALWRAAAPAAIWARRRMRPPAD